jgi:hypothetical protein
MLLVVMALVPGALLSRPGSVVAVMANQKYSRPFESANLGSWSAPFGIPVIGIHAALLTNGNVLFFYSDQPQGSGGSLAAIWNPITNAVTVDNVPFDYNVFCGGMSYLPNGLILVTGGKDDTKPPKADDGIPEATLFDPSTSAWSQAPNMSYARWYPTNIELADGTVMVVSGDDDSGNEVLQIEEYHYQTNTFTTLPSSANISPNQDIYPRLVLLPSGNVFMGGFSQSTTLFNPVTNAWSNVAMMNYGSRAYGGMVLLPGLRKVLAAGGRPSRDPQDGVATNTVETIDFSQPTPAWSYVAPMNYQRQNQNMVLLPDGTVLAVGGGTGNGIYANPVYRPEGYDPVANTWTLYNPQKANRTYHSTALLLPDGRVASAGSNSGGKYQKTVEVFSPPYLSKGVRPTITEAPNAVTYNQQFTVTTPDAAGITRVALIKVATTTHATRFDERFTDLTFTVGKGQITATAPPNGNYAPPGYYMLDVLNSNGVPAVMPFIQLKPHL